MRQIDLPRIRISAAQAVAHSVLAAAFLYTLVFASHFTFRFEPLRAMDHYRWQANGLVLGKLDLHDDNGNVLGPVVDSVNYKGKSYIGYGLFPAVVQVAFHHLLHWHVDTGAIVWMLVVLCLYALYWLAFDLCTCQLAMSEWMAAVVSALLTMALATTVQCMHETTVPYSWSQAGCTGQLFTLLALRMVLRYSVRPADRYLLLAGVFTGLAAFSKQNFAFAALPIALFLVLTRTGTARHALFLYAAPLAAIGICMGAVNMARFGNPLEFGVRYANASEANPADWSMPQIHRIPYNFYNHFLAPYDHITSDFPMYLGHPERFGGINRTDGSGGLLHSVPQYSAFLSVPLLGLIPLHAAWLAVGLARRRKVSRVEQWWCLLTTCAAAVFFIYLLHDSSWLRYQFDFLFCAALAILITLVLAMRAACRIAPAAGIVFAIAVAGTCLWQAGLGADHALGLLFTRTQPFMYWDDAAWRPSDDRIGARAQMLRAALFAPDAPPGVFHETETLQSPAPSPWPSTIWHSRKPDLWFRADGFEWTHVAGEWPGASADVTFPQTPRSSAEPLFVAGSDITTADIIAVRYGAGASTRQTVTFFAAHWGSFKPCESRPFETQPGHTYRMKVFLSHPLHQVAVTLDGEEVLYCHLDVFPHATAPSFGTAMFESPKFARQFSGKITPRENLPAETSRQ